MIPYKSSCLLALLLSGAPLWVCAEEAPPPKVHRDYSGRVQLHDATTREKPKETTSVQPGSAAPERFMPPEQPMKAPTPAASPSGRPASRDAAAKEREEIRAPWSLAPEPEFKPTGWGWLADEIAKSNQSAREGERGADAGSKPDDNPSTAWDAGGESADPQGTETNGPSRESRDRDPGVLRIEVAQPVLPANLAWGAMSLGNPGDEAERGDRPPTGPEAEAPEDPAGLAFDARNALPGLTPGMLGGDTRAWSTPAALEAPGAKVEEGPRGLFRVPEAPASSDQSTPRYGARSLDERGMLSAPSAASTPGAFGSSGAQGFSSGFGAMDIQPSISAPAPVSTALELPSSAPSTPSLGGMGREEDTGVRTKTLPW